MDYVWIYIGKSQPSAKLRLRLNPKELHFKMCIDHSLGKGVVSLTSLNYLSRQ